MQVEHESTAEEIVSLADRLQRQLGLLAESNDRRLGRFKSAREARARAQVIRSAVLHTLPSLEQQAVEETILIGDSDKLRQAVRMLSLMTGRSEKVVIAARCIDDRFDRALLFVLDDALILTKEKHFFDRHQLNGAIANDEIRFVYSDDVTVSVATTEGTLTWEWPTDADKNITSWTVQLLASSMNLPADEVPPRPEPLEDLVAVTPDRHSS